MGSHSLGDCQLVIHEKLMIIINKWKVGWETEKKNLLYEKVPNFDIVLMEIINREE